MFTVDYELGGAAQAHDHPFEEAYVFLAGEVEAEFDGQHYVLRPGRRRLRRHRVGPRFLQHRRRAGPLDRDPGAPAPGSPRLSMGPRLGAVDRDHANGGDHVNHDGPGRCGRRRRRDAGDRPRDRPALRGPGPDRRPQRPGRGERGGGRRRDRRRDDRARRSTSPSRIRSRRRLPTSGRSAGSCWPRSTATRTRSRTTTSPRRSSS